jgi:hypothetical protein
LKGAKAMNHNDRFMIDENGTILNPKIAEFFIDEDLYSVFYCDNTSGFREHLIVIEVWANEAEFIGYIVKRANAEVMASWITELINVYKEGYALQSARGANPLPAILNKA